MEKRREVRFSVSQPVRFTVLGDEPSGSRDTQHTGLILDYSGRGFRLRISGKVLAGSAVRLDFEDQILLGEVCYCQPIDGGSVMGIELEQSLNHLDDLSRLVRALMGDLPVLA